MSRGEQLTLESLTKKGRSTATVPEVAEILGISLASTYQAIRAGQIPAIRLGRKWLVPVSALIRMLEHDRWS
ncbi:MAG: helix-turn-helix domain-containing protein [Armatimonadetes bacterium]|nr:helix-turn-helix domain-containing protein [Armatimonadota bacterium]